MRKIVLVSIVVALAISAGAYVYFYQPFSQQTVIESVLPGETMAMVRVCELNKQIERFKAGRLGQSLAGIDLARLMEVMEVPVKDRLEIIQNLEKFKTAIDSPWFNALFGRDIALAVLNVSFEAQQSSAADIKKLLDAFVLVSRPKQPTHILESLNSLFATQLSVETQTYKQWDIHKVLLKEGRPLYYALTDGLAIAGLSAVPVQRCLEQSLTASASLLQSAAYQKHCSTLFKAGQTDYIAFVDADEVFGLLFKLANRKVEKDTEKMALKAQLESIQGVDTINLVQYDDGGSVVRSKLILEMDRERLSPMLAQIIGTAPVSNVTLKLAPMDTLLYSWSNNFDLKLYWKQVQEQPGMSPETVAQFKQTFAKQTGMALDALLEAFGTQAGLLLNDINTGGMFPIPELAFFIQVKQPEVVDQLIKRQIKQLNMALQKETYHGTDLQYLVLPMGADLSPAYTFSDGFCTVAVNRNLLKSMLDAEEANHLSSDPSFVALNQGLTDENNQVFFMHAEGLLAKVREVVDLGLSWMAMSNPKGVEKAKQVVALGINPLLDGIAMIKAVSGRTYIEDDHITSDVQALLDRTVN